jgi:hypothetical protein
MNVVAESLLGAVWRWCERMPNLGLHIRTKPAGRPISQIRIIFMNFLCLFHDFFRPFPILLSREPNPASCLMVHYDDASRLPASQPFGISTHHHFGGDCHRCDSWRVDIPTNPGQHFRRGCAGSQPTIPTEGSAGDRGIKRGIDVRTGRIYSRATAAKAR